MHTTGPWNIGASDDEGRCIITSEEGEGRVIAEVDPTGEPEENSNARLITAAPDLLRAAADVLNSWERGDLAGAVNALQRAVEKAYGEPWCNHDGPKADGRCLDCGELVER